MQMTVSAKNLVELLQQSEYVSRLLLEKKHVTNDDLGRLGLAINHVQTEIVPQQKSDPEWEA